MRDPRRRSRERGASFSVLHVQQASVATDLLYGLLKCKPQGGYIQGIEFLGKSSAGNRADSLNGKPDLSTTGDGITTESFLHDLSEFIRPEHALLFEQLKHFGNPIYRLPRASCANSHERLRRWPAFGCVERWRRKQGSGVPAAWGTAGTGRIRLQRRLAAESDRLGRLEAGCSGSVARGRL